jgi:PAS domain S-box-containing protein
MKFRTKLTLLFVAIALFLTIIGTLFIYYSNLKILETQVKNRLEDDAFHIMDKIDRMLFERFSDIKTIASDPNISSRTKTPQQITERLIEYRNLYKTYTSLSFFDLNRVCTADTAGLDIGERHPLTPDWERVLKDENFIMEISKFESLQNVSLHFLSLVKNRSGFPFGVVISRMPVERLYDIVRETFPLREGEEEIKIDLVDKNGLLIYSTYNRKGILKDRVEGWESLGRSFPGEKVGTLRHLHSAKEEYIHTVANEQGYLDFKGNGWTLHIQIPIKMAFAPVVELRNRIIMVASGIVLFSIIIVLFFARTISRPIIELRNAAIEIGRGNLDVNIEVKSKDEVGELGLSFKKMVEDLKKSRDETLAAMAKLEEWSKTLEEKVEERTIKLAQVHEIALKERDKAQKYLDVAGVIILALNAKGEVILVNKKGCEILGNEEKEVVGKDWFDHFLPKKVREDVKAIFQKLMSGKVVSVKYVESLIQTRSGEERIIAWYNTLLSDESGNMIGTLSSGEDITERKRAEEEREKLVHELQEALAKVKTLSGMLPICASCKKIRDDKGYWNQIESYIRDHSEAEFSHGICPDCMKKLYPDFADNKNSV